MIEGWLEHCSNLIGLSSSNPGGGMGLPHTLERPSQHTNGFSAGLTDKGMTQGWWNAQTSRIIPRIRIYCGWKKYGRNPAPPKGWLKAYQYWDQRPINWWLGFRWPIHSMKRIFFEDSKLLRSGMFPNPWSSKQSKSRPRWRLLERRGTAWIIPKARPSPCGNSPPRLEDHMS